jgi:diacylglycerol O-acyltransferase/trehalose O-mycolyltransferase
VAKRRPLVSAIALLAVGALVGSAALVPPARAVAPPAAPASDAPGSGACRSGLVTEVVPVPPSVHVTDNHVNVLLPSGYCSGGLRYPVLYVLHGAGDTYKAWATNTDLVSFARPYQVIIVMPDGGKNAEAGWYSNWLDGEFQWETFHTQILPAYINSHFRTLPHDIAIAGLSMGGFGAMSYAARHRGMYRAAASFSGAVDTLYGAPASGIVFSLLRAEYGTPGDQIWGNQLTNESDWAAHNPTSLAANLKGTALFIASGTGTPGGPEGDDLADLGGYALEAGIFQMNLAFVLALDRAGVAHSDHFYLGGYHGWPYWQADLHWALPRITATLGPPQR